MDLLKFWQVTSSVTLSNITQFNNFLLDVNFNKFTIGLHYLCEFSMFAKFQDDKKAITMSSINCLNLRFYSLK